MTEHTSMWANVMLLCTNMHNFVRLSWIYEMSIDIKYKLAKHRWILPVQEKISNVGVCVQILLRFQPSPSFKSISNTNSGFISDFVTTNFWIITRSFWFSNIRHFYPTGVRVGYSKAGNTDPETLLTSWLVDRWRVALQAKTQHVNINISWGLQQQLLNDNILAGLLLSVI